METSGSERPRGKPFAGRRFRQDAVTEALRHEKIWAIREDSEGGLWFGTERRSTAAFWKTDSLYNGTGPGQQQHL